MAKYFLGSVGDAEAYEVISDLSGQTTMNLIFTCKTLTSSAINISVNKEQIIDSYNGAPAGVFYHSPNISITLSDIMWNSKFIEVTMGHSFNNLCDEGNIEYYQTELTSDNDGIVTLPSGRGTKDPVAITNNTYIVLGQLKGSDEWYSYNYDADNKQIGILEDPAYSSSGRGQLCPNSTYCFKYITNSSRSRTMNLTTKIVPEELFLVITTPIFMAEDRGVNQAYNMISTGSMVGQIVYEVPRWALDADMSFNFSMSGTSDIQLVGNVLESIDNEEEPTLMRLREFLKPVMWYEGLVDLLTTTETLEESESPDIYGIYADGSIQRITSDANNIKLVFKKINGSAHDDPAEDNIYGYHDQLYNVGGKFTNIQEDEVVKIYPAVTFLDDDNHEIFIILENIYCQIGELP